MTRLFSLLLVAFAPALTAGMIPVSYSTQNGEYVYVPGCVDKTSISSNCPGAAGIALPTPVDVTICSTAINVELTPQSVDPTTLNEWHTLNVGRLTGSSVRVKMYHGSSWTFMDEAAFLSPEEFAPASGPSSGLLLAGAGLILLLLAGRKTRAK